MYIPLEHAYTETISRTGTEGLNSGNVLVRPDAESPLDLSDSRLPNTEPAVVDLRAFIIYRDGITQLPWVGIEQKVIAIGGVLQASVDTDRAQAASRHSRDAAIEGTVSKVEVRARRSRFSSFLGWLGLRPDPEQLGDPDEDQEYIGQLADLPSGEPKTIDTHYD